MKRAPTDTGMTLIELVVAMAIFALVAIMGLQSLTGVLGIRDRLVTIDDQNTELGLSTARLRNDLTAALPLLFYPPDRGAPQSALRLASAGSVFSISIGGQPDLTTPQSAKIHRAEWRLDRENNQLYRRVWTTLTPANQSPLAPEVLVLEGVTDFEVRSFWDTQGWIDGVNNPFLALSASQNPTDGDTVGGAPETYSDILPSGIEITLTTQDYGRFTLLESLR